VHRQREDRAVALEERGGAVALVDVEVDDSHARHALVLAHIGGGHREVVEDGEAGAGACTPRRRGVTAGGRATARRGVAEHVPACA